MKGYLYAGGNTVPEKSEIIGIFDTDNSTWAKDTRQFLSKAEKNKKIRNEAEDLPKSFIVCADGTVLMEQPNSAILAKRWENT